MGKLLAKLPQQRIRAGENHPTTIKLEKLFDYMDELNIELSFLYDRIYVKDMDRPNDDDWEVRDVVNSEFLLELPCNAKEYKITQNVDIPPRNAQSAPESKKIIPRLKKKIKAAKK